MRNIRFCIFIYLICLSLTTKAQEIDSLKHALSEARADTTRVRLLNAIAIKYYRLSADSMDTYAHRALVLSKRINHLNGLALTYTSLGVADFGKSNFNRALRYYDSAIYFSKKAGNMLQLAKALNYSGIMYSELADYRKSLLYYDSSLLIKREIHDVYGEAGTINNMGLLYQALGEYERAYKYYLESLRLKQPLGNKLYIASSHANIGNIHVLLTNFDSAREHYTKALNTYSHYQDKRGIAELNQKIGDLNFKMEQYDVALEYFGKSKQQYYELGDLKSYASLLFNIAQTHFKKDEWESGYGFLTLALSENAKVASKIERSKILLSLAEYYRYKHNTKQAIESALQSLDIAMSIHSRPEVVNATSMLHSLYLSTGNYKSALQYFEIGKHYSDSIIVKARQDQVTNLEIIYELDKAARESRLKNIEISRQHDLIEKQTIIIIGGALSLVLTVVLIITLYKYYISKKKSVTELEKLNAQITEQAKLLEESNEEIRTINNSLEGIVQQRTQKISIQNEKIKEYLFANSHLVRAPLARLLGLILLLERDEVAEAERKRIKDDIKTAALELDNIIRGINRGLEEI